MTLIWTALRFIDVGFDLACHASAMILGMLMLATSDDDGWQTALGGVIVLL